MSCLTKTMEEKNLLLSELTSQLEQRVDKRTPELKSVLHELQQAYLELLAKEDKLGYYTFHDSLTGLANRACFIQRLNRVIERANLHSDYLYAVLFIDLDRRATDVLKDADVAMYQAKIQGKGRYEILTKAFQAQAAMRLQLENDLRKAIEEFCLYYQPILLLSTGHILGFEALVRWPGASDELMATAKFIPLAEEIGAINSLGWWVFQEACRQLHC